MGPIDAITAIHNAARKAMASFDQAALAMARGEQGHDDAFKPLHLFDEIIRWHAEGEELALFPLANTIEPTLAEDYARDHQEIIRVGQALEVAVSSGDKLEAARSAAAFRLQLHVHLAKEDAHLYPSMTKNIPEQELYRAVGESFGPIPKKRLPEVVNIVYMLMSNDDREKLTRVWQKVFPPTDFAGLRELIRSAVGSDWAELTRRIPELERTTSVRMGGELRREATSGPGAA